MPVWNWVAHRFGKEPGYLAATLMFIAGTLVLLIGGRTLSAPLVYAAIGLCGMAYGGLQMFPLAMLPDCIAADTARSGHARAGVFTGMWAAGETLGFALGPGLVLVVLALSGFVSSRADEQVTQPDSAITGRAHGVHGRAGGAHHDQPAVRPAVLPGRSRRRSADPGAHSPARNRPARTTPPTTSGDPS